MCNAQKWIASNHSTFGHSLNVHFIYMIKIKKKRKRNIYMINRQP